MGRYYSFNIIKTYAPDDKDFFGDAWEVAFVDAQNDDVIMSGDWYHDKIDERIQGFLECLDWLDAGYSTNEIRRNEIGEV